MGDGWRGRFVGVGEGAYQHHEPLERAVGDIEQLRALLQGTFDGERIPAGDPALSRSGTGRLLWRPA